MDIVVLDIQDGATHGEPSDINSHPHGNERVIKLYTMGL